MALMVQGAWGAEFCVNNATDFQTALTTAQSNNEDDIIKVVQGTYTEHFTYITSEGHSITLLGGYRAGCTTRELNPANTVLDGGKTGSVLYLFNDTAGDIRVDGFTMQNGVGDYYGGGVFAYAHSSSGTAGNVTITNNIVTGNSAPEFGGGGAAYSKSTSGTAGNVTITNNIVTGNSVTKFYGGGVHAELYSGSGTVGTVTLTNNTIAENTANGFGGGAYLNVSGSPGGTVNCYDNIIWGNTGGDIYLQSGSRPTNGYNNDYTNMVGSWTNSANNIDADPLFVGSGDYHLQPSSPCIDVGNNSAPGLPSTDFEGDDRIVKGTVDIGADEYTGLVTPPNDTTCLACTLINKYQPTFQWMANGTFKNFTILFSISPTDFSSRGILITKATIQGTRTSHTPSLGIWKKIMTASNNSGSIQDIYWKVTGIRTDNSQWGSAVRYLVIDDPLAPLIQSPADGATLSVTTPPTFNFNSNCNVKFRLEFSPQPDNFNDPHKIKGVTYHVKDPVTQSAVNWTLTSSYWTAVVKLVGNGPGVFRIRAWDGMKRETVSETRSFTVQ